MKVTSLLVSISAALSVRAVALTSTIFWGDCWTQANGGTITTSLPGATTTLVLPEPTTITVTQWIYPPIGRREAVKKREEKLEARAETTVFMVNQCTKTRTATVTSTVREVIPTLTATVTKHASTAFVTTTALCPDWECE
ncbi:hypothetical protein FRB91_003198 [Serendipita sp. 411]|nr:hypothetical protein FRB91_003198 [Serendipita sp. 411]